jgi:DNA polymerase
MAEPRDPDPPARTRREIERAVRDGTFDAAFVPAEVEELAMAVRACRRCDLWRRATQGVPGEGPRHAAVMLVGEQPGDQEDRAGHPFVGPAGQLLDKALAQAGLARDACYVTNAVKHFKFELRGERRIHAKPNVGEIDVCRWWLENELKLVRPKAVVALGATAGRAVLRRPVTVAKARGKPVVLSSGARVVVSVHPSYLLRLREPKDRERAFVMLVEDLRAAKAIALRA